MTVRESISALLRRPKRSSLGVKLSETDREQLASVLREAWRSRKRARLFFVQQQGIGTIAVSRQNPNFPSVHITRQEEIHTLYEQITQAANAAIENEVTNFRQRITPPN